MLGRRRGARLLLRAWLFATAECIVIVFFVLITTASHIRAMPVGQATDAAIGPLALVHVAKLSAGSGYTLSFSLAKGLLVLAAACYGVQAAVLLFLLRGSGKDERGIADA